MARSAVNEPATAGELKQLDGLGEGLNDLHSRHPKTAFLTL